MIFRSDASLVSRIKSRDAAYFRRVSRFGMVLCMLGLAIVIWASIRTIGLQLDLQRTIERTERIERMDQPGREHERKRAAFTREYAKTLWSYNERDAAIDTLTMALTDYRTHYKGVLPRGANNTVSNLVSYFRSRRHFSRGSQIPSRVIIDC